MCGSALAQPQRAADAFSTLKIVCAGPTAKKSFRSGWYACKPYFSQCRSCECPSPHRTWLHRGSRSLDIVTQHLDRPNPWSSIVADWPIIDHAFFNCLSRKCGPRLGHVALCQFKGDSRCALVRRRSVRPNEAIQAPLPRNRATYEQSSNDSQKRLRTRRRRYPLAGNSPRGPGPTGRTGRTGFIAMPAGRPPVRSASINCSLSTGER